MAFFIATGNVRLRRPEPFDSLRLREQFFCGVAAGTNAVGNADAAVSVAGESEAGQLLAQAFDAVEAIEMSDAVLRHGGLPFVDAGEERLGTQAEDLLQFVAHDADDVIVGERPNVFSIHASKKAAQERAVLGSAMGEFVVNESRSQQLLSFTAWDKESEARWKRLTDSAIVTEADGDG